MQKEEFLAAAMESERTLYRVAKTILRSDADCADAVQEALLKGIKNAPMLRDNRYVKTWLTRILINTCKDMLRRAGRVQTVELTDVYASIDRNLERVELYDALQALDDKLRLPLVLYYLEGFPMDEVARMLKITEGLVRRRLWQARKELREILREEAI